MEGNCPGGVFGSMDTWDVSRMTNMDDMFEFTDASQWDETLSEFNADISKWDVSRVTSMDSMFFSAQFFTGDISKWNVSRTTIMRSMFARAEFFKGNISKWDVSRVIYMSSMFDTAESFNGDISKWDVSRVSLMDRMFYRAQQFNASISAWNVSSVHSMQSMFEEARFFNADISKWDVSQVVEMTKMFDHASKFNADISTWNVSKVEFMHSMFQRAEAFNIDISKWDVSSVVDMDAMFKRAKAFKRILCGPHWIHSMASRDDMFYASPGGICSSTTTSKITDVPIEAVTITDTATSPSNPFIPKSKSSSFVVIVVVIIVAFTLLVWAVTVWAIKKLRDKRPLGDHESVSDGDNFDIDLAAPSMPLIPLNENAESQPDDVPETVIVPLSERTFATSNFKRYYDDAEAPLFQHYLLSAVNNMLKLYANRLNPLKNRSTLATHVNEFMKKIQNDAFKAHKDMGEDVGIVAEYLWTSGKIHRVVNNMELCSVLNAVIRDDIEEEVKAAVVFFRSINARRVKRVAGRHAVDTSYPPKGETWRGGGFRLRHRAFYDSMVGKKYRVPGFLATSSKRSVAANFAFDLHGANFCVIWKIIFDKRGKKHPEYRVQHMTFVSNTLIKGENEYLFAPYSAFTLVSIKWSTKVRTPHELVIQAAVDNRAEDENLPLAPWY